MGCASWPAGCQGKCTGISDPCPFHWSTAVALGNRPVYASLSVLDSWLCSGFAGTAHSLASPLTDRGRQRRSEPQQHAQQRYFATSAAGDRSNKAQCCAEVFVNGSSSFGPALVAMCGSERIGKVCRIIRNSKRYRVSLYRHRNYQQLWQQSGMYRRRQQIYRAAACVLCLFL